MRSAKKGKIKALFIFGQEMLFFIRMLPILICSDEFIIFNKYVSQFKFLMQ